ncbi:IQ domain-containing protein K [Trichoplax sp. H2]|nr:IQ domain-containing protein K [Trichoplax sp. H2]|eukprot:RDD38875.1 IQ domain-containing protein K [Trichoplax sp. H2]
METGYHKAFTIQTKYNIWEEILKENDIMQQKYTSQQQVINKEPIEVIPFDPAKVTPVMHGQSCEPIYEANQADELFGRFNPAIIHPAFAGYREIIEQEDEKVSQLSVELPDSKTCPPKIYLETYIFPVLMPALRNLILQAKKDRALERRRTKLNALEWLTEYIYKNNPNYKEERENIALDDIPFVKEVLEKHPRPPLPLSLLLSDDEAATIIQSAFRGYLVRRDAEVQELRQYQREMKEIPKDKIIYEPVDYWLENGGKDKKNNAES